jgi:hypothetical protein
MRWASPSTPESWRMTSWMDLTMELRLDIQVLRLMVIFSFSLREKVAKGRMRVRSERGVWASAVPSPQPSPEGRGG